MPARVLVVAGSDSGGGAGIQADIRTITALGGLASTAITAVTAQNSLGIRNVVDMPPAFLRQQMEAVLDDIGADIVKTGMLGDAARIATLCDVLEGRALKLVVDPVMRAKDGRALLDSDALDLLRNRLANMATVLTPNLPEAEILLNRTIANANAMQAAAQDLLAFGPDAVLLKGGHLPGPMLQDVLVRKIGDPVVFTTERIDTRHTHGTGCTLASALATFLAQGLRLEDAVRGAQDYVQRAIRNAPGFGAGAGPLGLVPASDTH